MLSRVYIIYLGLETIRSIRGTRTNDHALLLEISFPLVKIVETSKVVATYGVCMTCPNMLTFRDNGENE